MIKFAVIGTHWITKQFVAAARDQGWQLTAVYSRRLATAQKFAADCNDQTIRMFTELDDFFASSDYAVVYIASPNSLHFEQSKQALLAGKHVIVEKPACSNPTEMKAIISVLRKNPKLYYFEAARHFHDPLFAKAAEQIKKFPLIQGANLTYQKFSSRYDAFLAGQNPNVFTPEFSGGALQDLGVYVVYNAIGWFGDPQRAVYYPQKLRNGIDGSGTAILQYPSFQVVLNFGKTSNSYLPSEVYGLKETLVIDNPAELNQLTLFDENQQAKSLAKAAALNPMTAEVQDFDRVLQQPADLNSKEKMEDWLATAIRVNRLLYQLRQSAQITFSADEKQI